MRRHACAFAVAGLFLLPFSARGQDWNCERCFWWCPEEWWQSCEYACEATRGLCENCFGDCVAYYDYCRGAHPCMWASLQSSPSSQLSALLGSPSTALCSVQKETL